MLGAQARTGRRVGAAGLRHLLEGVGGVVFGIAFASVFFVLAAAGAMDDATAFTVAEWSGLGLIGCYRFAAAGDRRQRCPEPERDARHRPAAGLETPVGQRGEDGELDDELQRERGGSHQPREAGTHHSATSPLMHVIVPPPTQIVPAASREMWTRPWRPSAVPWLAT